MWWCDEKSKSGDDDGDDMNGGHGKKIGITTVIIANLLPVPDIHVIAVVITALQLLVAPPHDALAKC